MLGVEKEVFEGAKLEPVQVREMGVVEAEEVLMEKVIFEQEQCCVVEEQ